MHNRVASTASAASDPKRHQRGNFAVTHNLTVRGRGPRARSVVLLGIATVGAATKKQGD